MDFDRSFSERMARRVLPWMRRYFRSRVEGLERLPEGPFVGVGNHGGGILMPDAALWIFEMHNLHREAPLRILAHDKLLRSAPKPIGNFMRRLGAVSASSENAEEALRSGYAVQVYPGGDRDLFRSFSSRNQIRFANRTGYVRLALRMGVPLVPVVSCGAHETVVVLTEGRGLAKLLRLDKQKVYVWPLILGLPFGLWMGYLPGYVPFPAQMTLQVLDPIPLDNHQPSDADNPQVVSAIDETVRGQMQTALDALAESRIPFLG